MTETLVRTRRRVVVDQRELARAIGARIRAARQAAGLTQQELAGDRYTKAYISALELGHAEAVDGRAGLPGAAAGHTPGPAAHRRGGALDAARGGHPPRGRPVRPGPRGVPHARLARGGQDAARRAAARRGRGGRPVSAASTRRLACCRRPTACSPRPAGPPTSAGSMYWQAGVHSALDDPEMARHMLQASSTDGPDVATTRASRCGSGSRSPRTSTTTGASSVPASTSRRPRRRRRSSTCAGAPPTTTRSPRSGPRPGDHEAAVRAGTVALDAAPRGGLRAARRRRWRTTWR